MERVARVLRKAKQSKTILDDSQAVQAVWPVAVGPAIARHVTRLRVVRTSLVVEVEDALWQRQLRSLETQILDRVRMLLPGLALTDVEFRIGVPRREAQKASTAAGALLAAADEAEQIRDPVLKKVYQISRKKASA